MTAAVRAVGVVVPARDEEQLLPGCLASVEAAVAELASMRPEVTAAVVVVLDRCRDGSARVVGEHPGVRAVVSRAGCVGAARATGVAAVLRSAGAPASTWLACTDADTRVPVHWLRRQVELADAGHDLVLGTVEPDDLGSGLLGRWRARHVLAEGHPHVHGANLGIRASTYAAAGGFAPVPVHEDVLLVRAARAAGARSASTDRTRVVTAGRLDGRVVGGFASYLHRLAVTARRDQPAVALDA